MSNLKHFLLWLLVGFWLSGPVMAQESDQPRRWMTAMQVEQQFGPPIKKSEPVGVPVITFWEYGGYVVFFEGDRVLHTIRK